MKIVKDEGGREGLHSKVNGITYNSFVVTLDSGGSGKFESMGSKDYNKISPRGIWNNLYKCEHWRGGV